MIPLATMDAPARVKLGLGRRDMAEGLRRWPMWWLLALRAVSGQYRRTVLGPWWMTIQMAVFIGGLALLFGILLGQPLETFLPYVAVGYICFSLISGTISSGCNAFVAGGASVKGSPAPLSTVVYRVIVVQGIHFGHDVLLYIPIVLFFSVILTWEVLLAIPVVACIIVGGVGIGLWLGPLAARFRDVAPLVTSVLRLLFFITPVFWSAEALNASQRAALSAWNPLAYLLNAFRSALLGTELHPAAYAVTLGWAVVNLAVGVVVFSMTRSRLAYWV